MKSYSMKSITPFVGHAVANRQHYTVLQPVPREIWQEIYFADPKAIFHQSPQWMEYLCVVGGYEDISRLYEFENGKRLILPLVKRRGIPTLLAFAESLPYAWGLGGLLTTSNLDAQDVALVFDDLAQAGYLGVHVRPNPWQGKAWSAAQPTNVTTVPRCAHMLDLSGGFDEVWGKRFSSRTRNHVRRAEKSGLDVECDTSGRLIPIFYTLFEASLARWADQQHEPRWLARLRGHMRDPQHKLQAMADMLGDKCRVWVAWHQGRPAAAHVVLQDTNCSTILGAMDKELAAKTNANSLLYRLVIEEACKAGCRFHDLGETGFNESLAHFKTGLGAVGMPYADYHLERLPISTWDRRLRGIVKHLIGFKDA